MSVSTSEHLRFFVEGPNDVQKINLEYEKCDNAETDCEYGTVAIPAGTATQLLGPTGFLYGRIVTGTKLMLISDAPCALTVLFAGVGATPQAIPLQDVLVLNGGIKTIAVTTASSPVNLQVAVAGDLV